MAYPGSISKLLDNLNSSTLIEQYATNVTDNMFSANPSIKAMLNAGKSYDGGTIITEPIGIGEMSTTIFSGAQMLAPADAEVLTTAFYRPAYIEVPVVITDTDDLENRGRSAIIDLLEVKFEAAKKSMEKAINTELFTASASQTVKPYDFWSFLDNMPIDPTANPTAGNLGGIDRTTLTGTDKWRSKIYELSATSISTGGLLFTHLQYLKGLIEIDGGEKPDMIVTSQKIFNRLWAQATPTQQAGVSKYDKVSYGFDNIDFCGIPIVVDPLCESTSSETQHSMFFINTSHLYFRYHKDANFTWKPFVRGTQQLLAVKYMIFGGQLVCNEPRSLGRIHLFET